MAGISEKLRFILDADADGAIRGFEKVGASAERDLGKADQKLDKVGASMTKWGALSLAAGGLMAAGLLKAGGAASDLEESINVTGLVFGDASDEIGEFAETAATSLGLSETAARTATASFGGLLKNLEFGQTETVGWSKDLTTLAADMASAFNTSTEDAVLAIGSALRGEQEPIRRYNVMLDDAAVRARAVELGLAATTAEVDNHGKAQARLSLIMEQTSDIQGDFANTSEGAANATRVAKAQFENFQATLGQAVLPIMQSVLGATNDLFSAFNNLPGPVKELISQLAVLGTGTALFGGAALLAAGKVLQMRTQFAGAGASAGAFATKMAVATAAIGLAVYAYQQWSAESRYQEERTRALTEAIREQGDVVGATADSVSAFLTENADFAKVFASLNISVTELAESAAAGGAEWDDYRARVMATAEAAGFGKRELAFLGKALDSTADSSQKAQVEAKALDAAERIAAEGADRMARSQRLLEQATGDVTDAAGAEGDAMVDMAGDVHEAYVSTTDLSGAIDTLISDLGDLLGQTTSVLEAEAEWEKALADVTAAVIENGAELNVATEAGQENLDALVALRDTLPDLAQAYIDETGSVEDAEAALQAHITALGDDLVAAGLSRAEVAALTETMGLTPEAVETIFNMIGLDAAAERALELKRHLDDIEKPRTISIKYEVYGDDFTPTNNPAPRSPSPAPEPTDRNIPLGQLAVAGGGTIIVNNYSADPDSTVRALEKAQREGRIGKLVVVG